MLGTVAVSLAACGAGSPQNRGAPAGDVLAGKSPSAIVAAAQQYVRTGNYSFRGMGSQQSTGAGLTGLPPDTVTEANSSGSWNETGVGAGDHRIDVRAQFDNGQRVYAREVGCTGFGSLDGVAWASSDLDRWLARMLAPSIDDATVSGTAWHDLGVSTVGGVPMHHLHAAVTPESLGGAAPSPGATPLAGISMGPSGLDLWVRASDATVARMTEHIDMTTDMSQFRDAQHPDVAGSVHSVVDSDQSLVAASTRVASPAVSLGSDPIPPSVALAFGPFGVQTDSCSKNAATSAA